MNGGSSAPYLACTRCVPLFCALLNRLEREGLLDYQGRAGIIFPLYGGTFAQSYSVSSSVFRGKWAQVSGPSVVLV